jgi:hypothetical protein
MSVKNKSGENPLEDNGLELNNDTPPVGESGETGTPAENSPEQGNAGENTEKPVSKIGLERYLQNFPKNNGITALLRLKHKADVKTIPEWESLIKELLHKKVQ